jgi:hypothetical protein
VYYYITISKREVRVQVVLDPQLGRSTGGTPKVSIPTIPGKNLGSKKTQDTTTKKELSYLPHLPLVPPQAHKISWEGILPK